MELTVLTRAGCGLCDKALAQVSSVAAGRHPVTVTDVDSDPELRAEFGDLVPVILINGREHDYGDIDLQRLRAALQ